MAAVAEYLKNLTKQEFIAWCASQIGTTENPPGSNKVPYWLNTKPEWNGGAWCAAFLQSGALRSGEDMRDDFGWGPYYVPQIARDAQDAKQWYLTPQVGDWAVMGNTGYSHIGVVEKVVRSGKAGTLDLIIQTIEGNTSPTNAGSQNNGDGVYRKTRTGSFVKGFFRPNYAPALASSIPPVFTNPTGTRWTRTDVMNMQRLLKASVDGRWGANTQARASAFVAVAAQSISHTTRQVEIVQSILGVTRDGSVGPKTRAALKSAVITFQGILKVTKDGNFGPGSVRAYNAFHNEWRGK